MQEVYREFTLREALDALEADAIPWTRGTLHKMEGDIVGAACAIGIMAINLGVNASDLQIKLGMFKVKGSSLSTTIMGANDNYSLDDAIRAAREGVTEAQLNTVMKLVSKSYESKILK